jgi:spermidine dehydrogenase
MNAAHAMRDGAYDELPRDTTETGEVFDCVVVGGGISGLSAALFFKNQAGAGRTCLVLENHSIFGGEARRNEFLVDGQRLIGPQGSNLFWVPKSGSLIEQFYAQIALEWRGFEFQKWKGPSPEMSLSPSSYAHLWRMPRDFGFYFGAK